MKGLYGLALALLFSGCSVVDRPFGDILSDGEGLGGGGGTDGMSGGTGGTGAGGGDSPGTGGGPRSDGPLGFFDAAAPSGAYNKPYEFTFVPEGGAQGYELSVVSGDLPPGLSLSNSGELTGVPTMPGEFKDIVILLVDADGDEVEVTIDIAITRNTWLAYSSNKNSISEDELFLVDISNDLFAETNLSAAATSSGDAVGNVQFSPDNNYLAFIVGTPTADQLFVVDISGDTPAMPVQFDSAAVMGDELDWSPDSRYLAYSHANDNIHIADFDGGTPSEGVLVGAGADLVWVSPSRLTYTDPAREDFIYVTVNDGTPGSPQSLIVDADFSGVQVFADVGGDDIVGINVPLDPCYQANYLVDFTVPSFEPIGSSNPAVYFSPDVSKAALAPYNYTIDIMAPPTSMGDPLLSVDRELAAPPSEARTCDNGAWSPDSQLFASVDNETDYPWVADLTGSTPAVIDITTGGTVEDQGTGGSSLEFLDDTTLLYLGPTDLHWVSIEDGEATETELNSSPVSSGVFSYATYGQSMVAYVADLDTSNTSEVYLRRRGSSGDFLAEEKLNSAVGATEDCFNPKFSGDASYLVYDVRRSNPANSDGLFFVDLADSSRDVHAIQPPVTCASPPCESVKQIWLQP